MIPVKLGQVVHAAMAAMDEDFSPIDDLRASAAYRMTDRLDWLCPEWFRPNG